MARGPKRSRKEADPEDRESEDEDDWKDDLRLYIQQQTINFLIKKNLTKEAEETLKPVNHKNILKLKHGEKS